MGFQWKEKPPLAEDRDSIRKEMALRLRRDGEITVIATATHDRIHASDPLHEIAPFHLLLCLGEVSVLNPSYKQEADTQFREVNSK